MILFWDMITLRVSLKRSLRNYKIIENAKKVMHLSMLSRWGGGEAGHRRGI